MHIIMGGTGHVGSEAAKALLQAGEAVGIITRNGDGAEELREAGAKIIEADVEDVDSLRMAFGRGRRAFLLNPPGDTSKDSDSIERNQVANILAALEGSGLEKVVVESVSGARPCGRIGDLSVIWELQQGVAAKPLPASINGAGYYVSNSDAQLDSVRETGKLSSLFPADLKLPMVGPTDLGRVAAKRLTPSIDDIGIWNIEGPERYSSQDVADAFAHALSREVHVDFTPPDQLEAAFSELGFLSASAESYARMTRATIEQIGDTRRPVWRGRITLAA